MENREEIWKDIPGYEGYYQVSSFGNVKSVDRYSSHWRGGVRLLKSKKINPYDNRGYSRICLTKDNTYKKFMVHQLVAMAFLDHKQSGMLKTIDHKDNNKKNNNLYNLEIVSMRENNIRRCNLYKSNNLPTGVKEVIKNRKYRSTITINGKKSMSWLLWYSRRSK